MIDKDIAHAQYLEKNINTSDQLELLAPVALNVVNFRYIKEGFSEQQLNELNSKILLKVQNSGVAMPSNKTIQGKNALRVAFTNHRSQISDLDMFITEVVKIGNKLTA